MKSPGHAVGGSIRGVLCCQLVKPLRRCILYSSFTRSPTSNNIKITKRPPADQFGTML